MKKALLCFLLLSLLSIHAKAQQNTLANNYQPFKTGTWLAGLQTGYSNGLVFGHNLTANAYVGCFVASKLWVGLSSTWSLERLNDLQEKSIALGPMVRYQLTRSRFSPYVVAAYQLGNRFTSGQGYVDEHRGGFYIPPHASNRTKFYPSFGAGMSVRISPSIRIDLGFSWSEPWDSFAEGIRDGVRLKEGLYQPRVGLTYAFSSK
jgi:hypothetical protein